MMTWPKEEKCQLSTDILDGIYKEEEAAEL